MYTKVQDAKATQQRNYPQLPVIFPQCFQVYNVELALGKSSVFLPSGDKILHGEKPSVPDVPKVVTATENSRKDAPPRHSNFGFLQKTFLVVVSGSLVSTSGHIYDRRIVFNRSLWFLPNLSVSITENK